MSDTVIVIGEYKKRSWRTALVAVGIAVVIALLALLLYHPVSTAYIVITIYNPSNQPTANPHDQPITMSCAFLQELWGKVFGYSPSCQAIAYNVTFIEDKQVLPAYPVVSDGSITWWVKMPEIPADSSVNVVMVLGKPESITNPQNVFLIYGNISSLQLGYIYVLNTTRGITTIYDPFGVYPFIYVVNGSAWLFTPNSNSTSNGFRATSIGSGYLSIAVTPSSQYLISTVQSWYAPFNTTYQPTNLTGTYAIAYTPQSILDELGGLGAAYVTPLVNPPALSGYTAPQVSTNPYYLQLPQCTISSNPYGGATGTYSLLNCIAIRNTGITVIIRFYLPPSGYGVLLSFQSAQYPSTSFPADWISWLYVGLDDELHLADAWNYPVYSFIASLPISPGWHTAIATEYYNASGSWYGSIVYLDNPSTSAASGTAYWNIPALFGGTGPFPYGDIGTGYSSGWPNTPGSWFFFNGVIQYVALYPGGPNESAYLINKGVFNIADQTYNYVSGYAIDYPPNGVEPIITSIHVNIPGWVPAQSAGVVSYSVHVVGS